MGKVVSAGFVVVHRSKVLVLHHDAGHWDLPKGHVEVGESLLDTALRELKEETGLSMVDVVLGFKQRIHYFFREGKERVSKDVYFFLCKSKSADVTLSEHDDFAWLPFDKAIEKLTFDTAKQVVRKAQEFLK